MRITVIVSFAFFLFSFFSCSTDSNDAEVVELQINHYKTVASGPFPGLFFITQTDEKNGSEDWSVQYSGIANFEYEWGYTYKILATKEYFHYEEPVADAPSYRYVYLRELDRGKVSPSTRFDILLQRTYDDGTVERFWEGDQQNGLSILGIKSFICVDLCDELTVQRDVYTQLTGTFEHVEEGEIRLVGLKNQEMVRY